MASVAVCVATMGHPEVVRDVLEQSIVSYYNMGIDIYYYDSSEDDLTERIVRACQQMGYDNLHYIKVSARCGYPEKLGLICEGYGLIREYDYIWPVKDRSFCPQITLKKVLETLDTQPDLVMLGIENNVAPSDKLYDDPVEFYGQMGWLATSLDAVIYRKDSVLAGYCHEEFSCRNQGDFMTYWSIYYFLFYRLAEMKKARIQLLCNDEIAIYNSQISKSGWENIVFLVWKDCWIAVNDALPECYHMHKDFIIKATASLPWVLGSVERLRALHEASILMPENCMEVLRDWARISDIPPGVVCEIAYGLYSTE